MASPVLETFCCLFQNHDHEKGNQTVLHEGPKRGIVIAFNSFCIISAAFSIIGAVYQLVPKRPYRIIRTDREITSVLRQNYIINWLTVADLLATFGVLIRSSYWLNEHTSAEPFTSLNISKCDQLFCAISSGLIQYLYIATYFWTFVFALDTYFMTVNIQSYRRVYHLLSWGVSAVLCSSGLIPLYIRGLDACVMDKLHLMPHFIFPLLPLVFVMVANPILYYKTRKAVQTQIYGSGFFTDQERQILQALKTRFRAIMVAFFICWFPIILSAIGVAFRKDNGRDVFTVFLFLTAILNPLQGFFNSLLYKGMGLCPRKYLSQSSIDQPVMTNDYESSTRLLDSTESSPLLRERR